MSKPLNWRLRAQAHSLQLQHRIHALAVLVIPEEMQCSFSERDREWLSNNEKLNCLQSSRLENTVERECDKSLSIQVWQKEKLMRETA